MYKLNFLLTVYARTFYKRATALVAVSAVLTLAASFTAWSWPVALVFATVIGAVAAIAATLGILVLHAWGAAVLYRCIERFEAAYDAYRRAHKLPDVFYEEMDLAEAAAAERPPGR